MARTGEIGLFHIVGEEGLAAGVRRIVAVAGPAVLERLAAREAVLEEVAQALKAPATEAPERVRALQAELRKLRAQLSETRRALALGGSAGGAEGVGGGRWGRAPPFAGRGGGLHRLLSPEN